MVSMEMEIESTTNLDTEESKTLDEPSGSSKDDNNEEKEVTQSSGKSATDIKIPTADSKISNVRIVRGTKRMRLDVDSAHPSEKKETKDDPEAEAKIMRSLKRSCELWSMEDKNTFFKAVNEFGKDFDALQSYFLIQGKKKGLSEKMIKNKEQIRHFYYRTWLKISKHLKFSEDVKKTSQELYGLINYGELRRKLPRMHEKVQMKLNELVYWGSTQVRLRGKTMRIKTPICRALRKLNQLEGWQEDIKLPSRVTLELRPGSNTTWWQVQALAMNPRIRTLVPIQRRLSSILSFLQQRWRPWRSKTSANVENLVNLDEKNTKLLRVAPPEGCKISLPVVNLGEYLTSNSVSLNSYETRLGLKSSKVELLGSMPHLKGIGKKGVKKSKGDKKLNNQLDDVPDNSDIDLPESSVGSTSEKVSTSNNTEKSSPEQTVNSSGFPGRETVERIRQGWNVEEANTITVGDLFLMFGRDSKIHLEYWWESLARDTTNGKNDAIETPRDNNLSLALQKLLSIAKHNFGTNKGYDNASGSGETVISSRIPSTKESIFRRPFLPQTCLRQGDPEVFKSQLDKYRARNRRGRTFRQRSLVVQRVLPSAPDPRIEIILPDVQNASVGAKTVINESVVSESNNDLNKGAQKDFSGVFVEDAGAKSTKTTNSNSLITSAVNLVVNQFDSNPETDSQWFNSEGAEYSLGFSSLLGESPDKSSHRSQAEVPIIQSNVSNNICLLGENSVDYVAFANFASLTPENQKK